MPDKEQEFYTVKWNDENAPSDVGDAITDALLKSLAPNLAPLLPKSWKDEIKAKLIENGLPILKWQTRVEGSCGDLCNTTIELVHQYVERTTGVTASFTLANVGVSMEVQIKAQMAAGNYLPCPYTCTSNPSHLPWEKEKKEIDKKIALWQRTHRQWEADMKAYHEKIRKAGSAFDKNGNPFPTPVWPPGVDGVEPIVPPEPPAGRKKCRQFHSLWTAELKVTAAIIASGSATWTMKIADTITTVCTICCEPTATVTRPPIHAGG
jgi:hypothetical protein